MAVFACSATVLAGAPPPHIHSTPKGSPTLRRRPRVLARASSCKARVPAFPGLHRVAPALRYASHIIGARALAHPRQPFRAAPLWHGRNSRRAGSGTPQERYALRAHAHLAQESPPHRVLSSEAIAPAHGSSAAPRSLHARSRPSRACMAFRATLRNLTAFR